MTKRRGGTSSNLTFMSQIHLYFCPPCLCPQDSPYVSHPEASSLSGPPVSSANRRQSRRSERGRAEHLVQSSASEGKLWQNSLPDLSLYLTPFSPPQLALVTDSQWFECVSPKVMFKSQTLIPMNKTVLEIQFLYMQPN